VTPPNKLPEHVVKNLSLRSFAYNLAWVSKVG